MKIYLGLLVAGIATAWCAPAAAFDFKPYVTRPAGAWPEAIAIGDVNGDRLDDVVVATTFYFDENSDYSIFVFLQTRDGALTAPKRYQYGTFSNQVDLALVDFNSDGVNDVVVCHGAGVSVFLADKANGFGEPGALSSGEETRACTNVGIVDIDLDGKADVVAQSWSDDATLYFGDGRGGARSSEVMATGAGGYNSLAIGDVTGDGLPDLVLASQQSLSSFYVYPLKPGGGFGPERSYTEPAMYSSPSGVAIGDFNGDGRNDIGLTIPANSPNSALWLFSQNQAGALDPGVRMDSYDIPESLVSKDLDGDGRQDLLTVHVGWSAIGRYMQGSSSLNQEVLTSAPYTNWGKRRLAVGDINDDGCSDAGIVDGNYGLATFAGKDCLPRVAKSDYNGDGYSDLFWRNGQTGQNAIWLSAGWERQRRVVTVTNLAWQMTSDGDFNGDGKSDALWHNPDTGASVIWWSGEYSRQKALTRITNSLWQIAGTGDFDGDGKADILWRNMSTGANAIWRSGNFIDQLPVASVSDTQWLVAGVDDFNGDGQDDLLWHHEDSGANVIWRSAQLSNSQSVTDVTDRQWGIAGTGDFDGDRVADILWRNFITGANVIWRKGNSSAPRIPVSGLDNHWEVATIGDYDGNGKSDIVWRHGSDGRNMIWRGAAKSVPRPIYNVSNLAWSIVPMP